MSPGQKGQGWLHTSPFLKAWTKHILLLLLASTELAGRKAFQATASSQSIAVERGQESGWSTEWEKKPSSMDSAQMTRGRGMNVGSTQAKLQKAPIRVPGGKKTSSRQRSRLRNRQKEQFRPGEPWMDDSGILIQAHGGGVLFYNGTYYWFGEHKGGVTYVKYSEGSEANENGMQEAFQAVLLRASPGVDFVGRYSPPRVDVIGVRCYSSQDLLHWKSEGLVLKAKSHPDLDPANVLERPKVLFHWHLGKFVMWMHIDTGDYEWAQVGVAVADKVTGPYTYLRSWRPHNQQARDFTVFQDHDGSAYIAYSSEENSAMHIASLTPDYLDIEPEYKRILVLLKREAPAMFKYKQYYLLLTSGCTGWAPNRAEIFYATDVMGEWKSLGNPAAGGDAMDRAYTFFSQPAFVVPVHGKAGRFVFMADQWDTTNLGASRYVWLPMWVEEVPPGVLTQAETKWRAAKELHYKSGGSSYYTIAPGPLHIVIPWLDAWRPEMLEQPLDPTLRDEHWRELRAYPVAAAGV